jgi:hypothetical protein
MSVGVSPGRRLEQASASETPPLPSGPEKRPGRRTFARRRRRRIVASVLGAVALAVVVVFVLAPFRGARTPVGGRSLHGPGPSTAPGPSAAPAGPPVPGGPVTCKVGFYVEALHDSNVTAGTFGADLWMWSVCPSPQIKPLDSVEFTNANTVTRSFSTSTAEPDGSVYASTRVIGQFRHTYVLTGYPFDHQHLVIQFEDSNADTSQLVYTPDTAGTACAPHATLDDWRVERCGLAVDTHTYPTSFGDPTAPPTASYSVSRGTLFVEAKRSEPWTEYLKSTSVIYPSVLLIIISFFLMTEATNTLGARMSTAGGALFSVALSMKALSSQLNADNHFTLMDAIGLAALVCVVFAGGSAMWCQRQLDRDVPFVHVRAVSHRLGWSALTVFLAVNSVLVWTAVRG